MARNEAAKQNKVTKSAIEKAKDAGLVEPILEAKVNQYLGTGIRVFYLFRDGKGNKHWEVDEL